MDVWVQVTAVVAAVMAVAAIVIVVWYKARPVVVEEQGYPYEEEIEGLLVPLADMAIQAAFRLSEWAADELRNRLDSIDKKWVADSTYALFPESIGGFNVMFVKKLVTRERWEQIVQDRYDTFKAWFIQNEAHFREAFEEIKNDRVEEEATGG